MENVPRRPLVSVVVPVLDEDAVLRDFHRRLTESLAKIDGRCEIVYVDDGSSDGSSALIEEWAQTDGSVVAVRLARTFGMDIAMSAGLDYADGDFVVLIHADLQDPPELIPEMLEIGRNGADVVYSRRIGRDESRLKRVVATGFYTTMRRIARVPYQGQAGDFRLLSRRVVEAVRAMPERRRFLRGMVAWAGYTQVPIEYRRAGRSAGRGASYPELARLAVEAVTSFSDAPLNISIYVGLVAASVSGVGAIVTVILTLIGTIQASTEVWILVSVLFLGGVQLVSIGILGRYLARVHEEALGRPLYLVDRVVRSGEGSSSPDNGSG
jgi:polyisoprenyl-phosphate glycosyltransferase